MPFCMNGAGEQISSHTLQIQCPIWMEFGTWDLRWSYCDWELRNHLLG